MDPQKPPQSSPDGRQEFHPDTPVSTRDPQPVAGPAAVAYSAPADDESEKSFFRPDDAPSAAAPAGTQLPDAGGQADDTAGQSALVGATAPVSVAIPGPAGHDTGKTVTWTASEFIAHQKGPDWYLALGLGGLLVTAAVYFLSRDIFSAVVVALAAVLFGVAASRQPREIQYGVDDHGLSVSNRHYNYSDFRSFSIADEGPFKSINFMPLKRFMPIMSIYYDPADEDKIAEVISAHLPLETHKLDAVEKLMRRIRF